MQVCNINELREKTTEEDFDDLYEVIKSKVEASIEFLPDDLNKTLEEIAKEREQKIQEIIENLKIGIDVNYFSKTINISIEEPINYKTSVSTKKDEPKKPEDESTMPTQMGKGKVEEEEEQTI